MDNMSDKNMYRYSYVFLANVDNGTDTSVISLHSRQIIKMNYVFILLMVLIKCMSHHIHIVRL